MATGARADGQAAVDTATSGSLVLPLALAPALAIPQATARAVHRPARSALPWRDHVPGLPERLPRA